MNDETIFINPARERTRRYSRLGALFVLLGSLLIFSVIAWVPSTSSSTEILISFALSPFLVLGGFILMIIALAMRAQGRRMEESFQEYRNGHFLVQWTYAPDEWESILQSRLQHHNKQSHKLFLAILSMGLFIGTIFPLIKRSVMGTSNLAADFAWSFGVAVFLTLTVTMWMRAWARFKARDQRQYGGHTYVGATSAYCSGDYLYWAPPYRRLIEARLEEKERLQITLKVHVTIPGGGLFQDLLIFVADYFPQVSNRPDTVTYVTIDGRRVPIMSPYGVASMYIPVPEAHSHSSTRGL
jgi:FtsH-binding integral membrane protein